MRMTQHTHKPRNAYETQPSPQYMRYIYTCICIIGAIILYTVLSGIFSMQCYNELKLLFSYKTIYFDKKKPELILIQLQCKVTNQK